MNLKKIGKVLMRISVGTGPLSYEKRIYRATVSQRLRNTDLHHLVQSKQKSVTFSTEEKLGVIRPLEKNERITDIW